MPGCRRRLGCRRREVAAMTTLSCLLVLTVYTLALTWCIAIPQGVLQGGGVEVGVGVVGAEGEGVGVQDLSPVIAARKLQFDPAPRSLSSSNDNKKKASSSLLLSPSSSLLSFPSKQRKDGGGGGGGSLVQRHHRTLQLYRYNGKDSAGYYGMDNTGIPSDRGGIKTGGFDGGIGGDGGGGGINHNGVRTMHQQQQIHPDSSSSKQNYNAPSAIYLDEDSEEGGDGGGRGSDPGQDYRDGPRSHGDNNDNTSSSGTRRLPGAIIIGVKKAGTRALLEFLRIHPDVQAPGPEPHFFDRNYKRGLDWYRSLMPVTEEGQLTMEKTPSYFITREVPKRVQSMSRDVKLLVVVRDPVTRAISDYVQASSKRDGKMKPFEDMALLDHRLGIVNTSWGAIRIGVYTKHLERWFKYFPRSQFHFVSGEQLIANPAQVMQEVQDFLGLKQFITEKHFYLNATRGFPCLVKDPDNNSKPHCLGKTKGRRHPDVDPKVIERLRGFYRPFNAKLYQMVGRDFGWS